MQWILVVGEVCAKLSLSLIAGNLPQECPGLRSLDLESWISVHVTALPLGSCMIVICLNLFFLYETEIIILQYITQGHRVGLSHLMCVKAQGTLYNMNVKSDSKSLSV